jgi:glycosyltransferase involved in cell wall biosynthesis
MQLANRSRAEAFVRRMVAAGLNVAVVIPCYNVQAHIIEVVHTLPSYVKHIILVNDASVDDTPQL